ncbi:class I SAM-dependent DNA methyltransferase [Sporosarcina contaminans]|uniref:Class I SAM-dependent DNA methyltransferase n=1 Tax=Sporosarcina contaminans TaxID=633403 RepID=A0ABW3U4M7_9BACL
MNSAYTEFAAVYDELMSDIPYDLYVELIDEAVHGLDGKKVLDVGCGTGLLSLMLTKAGAMVDGIDLSEEMLSVARKRASAHHQEITFKRQLMQEINEREIYDAAVIPIDALNYVTDPQEVFQTFKNIYHALKPNGHLLFDVHSTYKTDEIFMEGPFTFDNGRIAYIWETFEGEADHDVYSEIAFFVKQESGLYKRFDEAHHQRTMPVFAYVEMLEKAGFTIERIFADWEDEPPTEESERIFFQVRK